MNDELGNHITCCLEDKDKQINQLSNDDYENNFKKSLEPKKGNIFVHFNKDLKKVSKLINRASFFTMLRSGFKTFEDLSQDLDFTD
jgi:hypothetical protein